MDRVETWLAIENVAGVDGVMVPRIAPPAPHRYWRTSSYVAPGETVAVAETGVAASEVKVVPVPDRVMIAAEPVLRSAITPRAGAFTVSSHPTACRVAALIDAVPDRVAVTEVVDRAGAVRLPLKVQSPLTGVAWATGRPSRLATTARTATIDTRLIKATADLPLLRRQHNSPARSRSPAGVAGRMTRVKRAPLRYGLALGLAVVSLAACSGPETALPTIPASPSSAPPNSPEAQETSRVPAVSPSPDSMASPSASPAYRRGREVRQLWERYPWAPDDGLACPAPAYSPGIEADPAGPGVVVVVGDSLIRESRDAITASLAEAGFDVVFVCWGGKNLLWGLDQVAVMRSLDLVPACLVINLGTNDLKGTTAQGLADAVPMATVSERLTDLLASVADVPDVFVVDLAADLSLAPGTMGEVGDAPAVWQAAVSQTGVGAAVPWSDAAAQGGLVGSDGIHDSVAGQYARASIITEYVVRDCPA